MSFATTSQKPQQQQINQHQKKIQQQEKEQRLEQNQQSKQQQKEHKKAPTTTSSQSFPTTYITAQNCFSNFIQLKEEPLSKTSAGSQTAPMIKNIDTTITTTSSSSTQQSNWNEKSKEEKEKESGNVSERRDSVTEEFFAAQDISSTNDSNNGQQTVISSQRLETYTTTTSETATISVQSHEEHKSTPTSNSNEVSANSIPNTSDNNTSANSNSRDTDSNSKSGSQRSASPGASPSPSRRKDSASSKGKTGTSRGDEADTVSKSSDTSGDISKPLPSTTQETQQASTALSSTPNSSGVEKSKSVSRLSERAKKKSWYNVLYPNYKSRAEDFKKLFKDVPNDERLIVDYSCALQRDILVQGRLYVSQNYVCFHANIFRWETYLCIRWKDVTSITKEKTALVIPNAISICTAKEKYFFATFTTRDKAFLMLFRVWQNTLMNKQMLPQEMWQYVHDCYGDELGLTTDDEDYIDPTSIPIETEGELEFSSALEDTASLNSTSQYGDATACSDLNTNTSNSNIFQTTSGSGSNSSGGAAAAATGAIAKSKPSSNTKSKKSYFFSSHKSSSTSTNATSGSDNKASDNNSGGDYKRGKMKSFGKELTLISAELDENASGEAASSRNSVSENNVNGSSNNTAPTVSSTAVTKDSKSTAPDGGKRKVAKNSRQRDETLSKNAEAIPTDISDSSDSEENKIPFVVTAECTSTHEGRQLVHTILPINIETLFNMLFSKSKFLVDFHNMRKSTDTNFPDWTTSDEGQKTRTVNVTVQLAASVGPKNSKVTEYQVLRDCSKPGELYSVDINSVNAGIPYADSFSVLMHYCLVRTVDDHTMLSVHAQIKYKKSIWGMVKGFIEKNTWAGLEDFFTALLHALQSETCIPPAKGKGRRPRRAPATQVRPADESSAAAIAQAKTEPVENLLAAHPLHLPHAPLANQVLVGEVPTSKYKWLSLFVIVLLIFLIVVNVILLHKLWKLEARIEEDMSSRARMPNLSSLKQLPSSHQEWIELLRQQEILHETELRKWHQVLQTAIELLKKTEKTLAELMFR